MPARSRVLFFVNGATLPICAHLPSSHLSQPFIHSVIHAFLRYARRSRLTIFHVENTSRAISEEDFEN